MLYSSNPKFSAQLLHTVRERWIAAWLYLRNRYSEHELLSNANLRSEIKLLANTLLQEVRDDPSEPFTREFRGQVQDLIDKLDGKKKA